MDGFTDRSVLYDIEIELGVFGIGIGVGVGTVRRNVVRKGYEVLASGQICLLPFRFAFLFALCC
jgi:hypothetical protein